MVITANGNNGCSNSKTYIIKNVSNPLGGLNSPGSTQNLCAPTANLQFSISNWGSNSLDTTYSINYGDGSSVLVLTQIAMVASSYYNAGTPANSTNYPIPHIYTTSMCPASSFQVSLDVTNACGTTPFTLGNISILIKPTADFTVPTNNCVNTSVLFTNTTANGYGQGCAQSSIYTWNFGDGSPTITTPLSPPQNINHTYTVSGNYTVTLTAQNFCGISTKTQPICIEAPVVPLFTLNTNAGCSPIAITGTNNTGALNQCATPPYLWSVLYTAGSCGTSSTLIPNQTTTNASYNFTEQGTYDITLMATNSCGNPTTNQTVTVKKPPTVSISPIAGSCGPITINPTTATLNTCAPSSSTLTYAWSFPGGTPSSSTSATPIGISYTATGSYTVSLTVSNECGASAVATQTFGISNSPSVTNTPLAETICSGSATSLVTLTSSIPGTTYTWTATATAGITGFTTSGTGTIPVQTITTTAASSGTVTYAIIPNIGSCNGAVANYVVTVVPAPTITGQPVSSSVCQGGTPTALSVTIINSGGTPTYQWYSNSVNNTSGTAIPGETNTSYTPPAGSVGTVYYYCVITLPPGGCSSITTNIASVIVTPATTISVQPLPTQSLCVGVIVPSALAVSYAGGAGTPTYQWFSNTSNMNSGGTAIPGTNNSTYTPPVFTSPGNYYYYAVVTLSGNGCGAVSSATATVVVSPDPTITAQPVASQSLCQNATPLALTVTATGGPGAFAYQWYSNTANNTTSGSIIPSATAASYTPPTTGVGITYYYCLITQPTSIGCSATSATATVTVISSPFITTQPLASTVCQNGVPNTLSVVLANAIGTPTYQWYSNIANNITTGTAILTATNASYVPPAATVGTLFYYCIITLPSGGCSSIASNTTDVTITPGATITAQPANPPDLCVGGTIATVLSISYSGGSGTPTYQWFSNTTNTNTGGSPIAGTNSPNYTPAVFNTAGTYYYYAIVSLSGNGCGPVSSNPASILVQPDPTVAVDPLVSQTVCQTMPPTTLSVTAAGGIGAFSYQWYSNSSNSNSSGTLITGETAATFNAPTAAVGITYYYCEITQASGAGCNAVSATGEVNVTLAPAFTSQPISSTVCQGGSPTLLSVTYSNGAGAPQYQWYSNSTNSTIGAAAISSATAATYNPPVVLDGTVYYFCIITFSSGGCTAITSNIAFVTVNTNPVIASENAIICSGNAFTVAPTNTGGNIVPTGTTYTWPSPTINPAGTITGTTAQSTAQTIISETLVNNTISPSTVTYTVTPISGACPGSPFTIVVTVNPSISSNIIIANSTCYGASNGSIQNTITGGIPFTTGPPYIISWTGPTGFTSSTEDISALAPGIYNLGIADAGGCPISQFYTITEPDDIVIITDLEKDITCYNAADGAIDITITGGTIAYNYSWTKNTVAYSNSEDLANLSPGIYTVVVSDINNCGPKSMTFTIIEPPILAVSLASQTNLLCYGVPTGAISINVAGGTPIQTSPGIFDYSYAWTGPSGYTSTVQNPTLLFAGVYNVAVTDASGCTKNLTVTLIQNPEIIITAVTTPIICYGTNDGSITLTISGGVGTYQVNWDNFATGTYQNNLAPGTYVITVTDGLGCTKIISVNLPSPPIFTIYPVVKHITCFGAHNGSINLNMVGGVAPVTLSWTDGSTSGNVRNNLGPGSYTANISDGTPCYITRTFIIVEPQLLVLSANITNALDCNNANSGAINLLVSGGTPPFNYQWTNSITTEDLTGVPAGNYLVTVTDANNCVQSAQYPIVRPAPIVIAVNTNTVSDCATRFVKQTFSASVSGGMPPFQLQWSSGTVSGANNEFMTTTQDGLIVLTATDALGCSANYTFNVAIPQLGVASITTNSIGHSSYGIYSIVDPILFTTTATGDYIGVSWNFGDGTFSTEINPVHSYVIAGDYVVTQTVTYPFGCVYVQTITLIVEEGYLLVVPTAFTPNNDSLNDTYRPVTKRLKNIQLDVYDTWGSLIYSETGDVLVGWDGTIKGNRAENGNYFSKVSGETFYGTTENENQTFVLIY